MSSTNTYAVLGATGNCGSALIEILLRNPNAKVNAYCRNKKKLIGLVPQVVDNKQIEVFEGSINDTAMLENCMRGASVIFHTVTSNTNCPRYEIGQIVTKQIIESVKKFNAAAPPGTKVPKVVLLSSATIDDYLARSIPSWFRPIMLRAHSHVYDDLRESEKFLRAEGIPSIFIKPGGLSVDKQRGHALSMEHEDSFVSYYDLAAGMIEAADDPEGRYDMGNVAVINTNGSARLPPGTPVCVLVGLLRHFFPWMHPYLPEFGPK